MEEHRRKQFEARFVTRRLIHDKVIMEWCLCGVCKTGNYKNILKENTCLSLNEITRSCNTLKIPTLAFYTSGKKGTWQRNQVKTVLFGKVIPPKQDSPLEDFFE